MRASSAKETVPSAAATCTRMSIIVWRISRLKAECLDELERHGRSSPRWRQRPKILERKLLLFQAEAQIGADEGDDPLSLGFVIVLLDGGDLASIENAPTKKSIWRWSREEAWPVCCRSGRAPAFVNHMAVKAMPAIMAERSAEHGAGANR